MSKIKTVLTRSNIIKYWKISIAMCQSSSANDECDESDGACAIGLSSVIDNREDGTWVESVI